MAFEYTQLTADEQLTQINQRIHMLEQQHLQLAVRVDAPGVDYTPSNEDKELLSKLEASISNLQALADPLTK